jgi:hypothetical protein
MKCNLSKHQESETKVKHILFILLRIEGLYKFRALLAHPQEALNKPHFVYYVRGMSVGCTRIGAEPVCPTPVPLYTISHFVQRLALGFYLSYP